MQTKPWSQTPRLVEVAAREGAILPAAGNLPGEGTEEAILPVEGTEEATLNRVVVPDRTLMAQGGLSHLNPEIRQTAAGEAECTHLRLADNVRQRALVVNGPASIALHH